MFHTWIPTTPTSDARNTQSHHCQSHVHAHAAATISASPAVSTRGKSHPRMYQCGWLLKFISVPLMSHTPASASVHCRISDGRLPMNPATIPGTAPPDHRDCQVLYRLPDMKKVTWRPLEPLPELMPGASVRPR